MKTPLTVGSLCSGIGGLDLGFERAGFKIKWQCEIDQWCSSKLKILYPGVHIHDDIKTLPSPDLADWTVDCIIGGIPCQPHSCAGKRQGANDERNLWPEYKRIIGLLRPRFAVLENVAGFLNSDGGRFFGGVLADLAELGYDAEWSCLRASDFGFPHRRKRVFVVAYSQSAGWDAPRECIIKSGSNEAPHPCGKQLADASGERVRPVGGMFREEEIKEPRQASKREWNGEHLGGGSAPLAQPAGRGFGIGGESSGGGGFIDGGQQALDNAPGPRHEQAGGGPVLPSQRGGECLSGDGRGLVADPIGPDEPGREPAGRETTGGRAYDQPGGSGGFLANPGGRQYAGSERLQGICEGGPAARAIGRSGGTEIPHAPPGPADADGWRYVLERWPWLAPAVEPQIRRVADEFSDWMDRGIDAI